MPGWVDLIIVGLILLILAIWIVTLRKRLLRLWTEVSQHEIRFYRQLEHVVRLFYTDLDHLGTDENRECVKTVKRYRKKRIRSLLLSTRQELFSAIQVLHDELDEREDATSLTLLAEFDALQKIRRLYNSRVLIYNQTINVFPTRYLALRMNLEQKEYFG